MIVLVATAAATAGRREAEKPLILGGRGRLQQLAAVLAPTGQETDKVNDDVDRLPRQLRIEPLGAVLVVPAGQTLLQAARAAGVRLPSSCRNGTCRACLCRLVAGTVHYKVEWPGLSAEEKAQGWTLPCVALADGDVVIDAPGAANAKSVP
jgi:ferredoxin